MTIEIHIDRDTCMGSGNCSFYAPATFDLDDEMKAVVTDPDGDGDDQVRLAVDACPTKSIHLRDSSA